MARIKLPVPILGQPRLLAKGAISSLLMLIISLAVIIGAVTRIRHPVEVQGLPEGIETLHLVTIETIVADIERFGE